MLTDFEAWSADVDFQICRMTGGEINDITAPYAEMYQADLSPAAAANRAVSETFKAAAQQLGWSFSPAHDGYISERHKACPGIGWSKYYIAFDAENACYQDGVETLAQADALAQAEDR